MRVLGFADCLELLCCPRCKRPFDQQGAAAAPGPPAGDTLRCNDVAGCGRSYPIVGGKPVLIDDERSVFSIADYRPRSPEQATPGAFDRVREWARRIPSPSVNLSAVRCFGRMKALLLERGAAPVVLVVGGGLMGKGMRELTETPAVRVINVDPSPVSDAIVFCDGHDVPFRDGSIDAVVVQAVLEHVADPVRCVEEIHRVLKPGGIVYSEIPFMQQVHQAGYDFTRFSHLGQRRLFRRFSELESGAVAGPGTALAWAWRYFLASFAPSRTLARVLAWIGRVTGMLIEQTDYLLRQRPAALDAASCIYFLGTKSDGVAVDRELVAGYRGSQR